MTLRSFCRSTILFLSGLPKLELWAQRQCCLDLCPTPTLLAQFRTLSWVLGVLPGSGEDVEWRMRLGGGRGRFGSQGEPCQVFQEAVFRRSQVAQSRLPGCPSQTKESKHGQRDAVERKKLKQVRVLEARASRKETSRAKHGTGPLAPAGPPAVHVLSVPTAAPSSCLGPSTPAHPPCSPQV